MCAVVIVIFCSFIIIIIISSSSSSSSISENSFWHAVNMSCASKETRSFEICVTVWTIGR